jgi:hypothetical protein
MSNNLREAVRRGVQFLAQDQERDGSFMCLVSTKLDDYRNAKTVPAIVPANIVLSSLIHIEENAEIKKIKKQTADFLLTEKSAYWSFNYWFRNSDWYKKEPYPDDLDDTFCALAALCEYQPKLFTGEVMAKIVTMLTSAEKKEGGPYDMWLVPPEGRKTWNDTDLVVNSNIAFFLSLHDISLPNVTAFIEGSIDEQHYEFPYNKIYPGIYFISRFYKGEKTEQMITTLLSEQEADGKWENPLRTALAISSLINFSGSRFRRQLEKGIAYLQKTQAKDGSWKPFSFYYQMRLKEKTLFAGSSSTTTALCIEAIDKFSKLTDQPAGSKIIKQDVPLKTKKADVPKEEQIVKEVIKKVKTRFAGCDTDLKREAVKTITKTFRGDTDKQIALLPYFFRLSLGESGKSISDEMIVALGAANVFGWIAYTIYDDFLDEEGDPRQLSIANVCLRESAEIFRSSLPPETGFADLSQKTFDRIDSANMWEVHQCRDIAAPPDYGDYSKLAERSLGHALSPIALLFALGYKEHSVEVQGMMQFFRNYLIARQLDDDAHDWEDDLRRGQINAAGAQVLRIAKGNTRTEEELKKIFWEKAVVGVCKDMIRHVKLARRDLVRSPLSIDTRFFEGLLQKIERSGEKALKERDATMKFIRAYKTNY